MQAVRRMLTVLVAFALSPPIVAEHLGELVREQVGFYQKLDCIIKPLGVSLGYDLRMHHRLFANVQFEPLRQGGGVRIRSYARALNDHEGRRYPQPMPVMESIQQIRAEDMISSRGRFQFRGSYPTGLGKYEFVVAVDNWQGKGCVMRWTSVARAPQQEPRGGIRLAPGEIGNRAMEMGAPQRAVEKRADGIRACVLLNVENRYREDFATDWYSAEIAIGTIRLIAEDPAVRAIAVVAFSLPQQEELYQQEFEATVDFPRLTAAYERLETGVVKLTQLGTERELEFLRQTVDANRSCLQGSDLMVVVSPWWRESYPLQDEVLRILQPRPQQTLGYVRPGSFMTRSRHERTFNSWRLVDGFRGAIDKAGGRIVNVVSPFGMVDDIQQLVTQAADLGKP